MSPYVPPSPNPFLEQIERGFFGLGGAVADPVARRLQERQEAERVQSISQAVNRALGLDVDLAGVPPSIAEGLAGQVIGQRLSGQVTDQRRQEQQQRLLQIAQKAEAFKVQNGRQPSFTEMLALADGDFDAAVNLYNIGMERERLDKAFNAAASFMESLNIDPKSPLGQAVINSVGAGSSLPEAIGLLAPFAPSGGEGETNIPHPLDVNNPKFVPPNQAGTVTPWVQVSDVMLEEFLDQMERVEKDPLAQVQASEWMKRAVGSDADPNELRVLAKKHHAVPLMWLSPEAHDVWKQLESGKMVDPRSVNIGDPGVQAVLRAWGVIGADAGQGAVGPAGAGLGAGPVSSPVRPSPALGVKAPKPNPKARTKEYVDQVAMLMAKTLAFEGEDLDLDNVATRVRLLSAVHAAIQRRGEIAPNKLAEEAVKIYKELLSEEPKK